MVLKVQVVGVAHMLLLGACLCGAGRAVQQVPDRSTPPQRWAQLPCCTSPIWSLELQKHLRVFRWPEVQAFYRKAGLKPSPPPFSNPALQWYIVVYGEPSDIDLEVDGEIRALRDIGFPPPVVIWEPNEQELFDIPHASPVILISHTTDDKFVNRADTASDPTDIAAGDYRPVWPLSGYTPGDMFFWGWPEPLGWLNNTFWTPPRTAHEGLYPFRHQPLLILASCFSRRLEGLQPNARGLSLGEFEVPIDEKTGDVLPSIPLVRLIQEYADQHGVKPRSGRRQKLKSFYRNALDYYYDYLEYGDHVPDD